MKTKQEGASSTANGTEETKAKTRVTRGFEEEEGGRRKKKRTKGKKRREWMGMSAGLAIQKDKADRKGERDYESER